MGARACAQALALATGAGALTLVLFGCAEDRVLSGDELRRLFSDRTVTGEHELHGYEFKSYYGTDGVLRSYQDASGQPHIAQWWIAGDRICLRWQAQSADLCRPVVERRGTYYKLLEPGGKILVNFERFTEGNPNGL